MFVAIFKSFNLICFLFHDLPLVSADGEDVVNLWKTMELNVVFFN